MAHSHVLMVYKRMLTLAQRLPAADRGGARNQIRAAFRENRDERNEGRIKELVELAHKKLGYLKVVTPRVPADELGGAKKYVVQDGTVIELSAGEGATGGGHKGSSFGVHSIDPDQLKRHQANIRRLNFMDRPQRPQSPFTPY